MKTIKLAVCSLLRVCASGRFFASLRLWRGRPEPIGDGYGRSTDAAGSIRPVVTNLVPAAVEVANNNERRSIAAFMNFNTRERKMGPKLVFCFMPKIRQERNGMAKAMKLFPLLVFLMSLLSAAPVMAEGCLKAMQFGYTYLIMNRCDNLPAELFLSTGMLARKIYMRERAMCKSYSDAILYANGLKAVRPDPNDRTQWSLVVDKAPLCD